MEGAQLKALNMYRKDPTWRNRWGDWRSSAFPNRTWLANRRKSAL